MVLAFILLPKAKQQVPMYHLCVLGCVWVLLFGGKWVNRLCQRYTLLKYSLVLKYLTLGAKISDEPYSTLISLYGFYLCERERDRERERERRALLAYNQPLRLLSVCVCERERERRALLASNQPLRLLSVRVSVVSLHL